MIFISHNHKDKDVVDSIANRLAKTFGKESVFYDNWSLRPGDSLTEEVNRALANTEYFFLFVTQRSLESEMVKMEWQPALMNQIKGDCRFIPIRLSDVQMPSILADRIHIDAVSIGLEATIRQMVDVINNTQNNNNIVDEFSNLFWTVEQSGPNDMMIFIHASHFMEPNLKFLFMVPPGQSEVSVIPKNIQFHLESFNPTPVDGNLDDGHYVKITGTPITPNNPLRFDISWPPDTEGTITGVYHHVIEDPLGHNHKFLVLPLKAS